MEAAFGSVYAVTFCKDGDLVLGIGDLNIRYLIYEVQVDSKAITSFPLYLVVGHDHNSMGTAFFSFMTSLLESKYLVFSFASRMKLV